MTAAILPFPPRAADVALNSLTRRLGPAPFSSDAAAGLRDGPDAISRMLDAAVARDDAAYAAARAEFWAGGGGAA